MTSTATKFLALSCLCLALTLAADTARAGDASPELQRFVLEIRDRAVQHDGDVIRVTQGQQVELVWTSDEPVQLHLHGYDIEFDVEPGTATSRSFKAHATGRFPITSHGFGDHQHGHQTLLYLEVHPD